MKNVCRARPWAAWLPLAFAFALTGCAGPAQQRATPEQVGIATQPLKDFSKVLQAKVDAGEIPGAVVLVARDGKVVWEDAVGWRDREAKVPMTTDSIFRIASMSKPITTVALMILVDEGKVRLDDPVSKYIPEFANMQVGVEKPDASGKPELTTEPARAPIKVIDLLRHTSGLTYAFTGRSLVRDRYNAADLYDRMQTNEQFAVKLAKLPLQLQPGERFEYSMSHDVAVRVVEVASGMGFGAFVDTRIFKPLGMNESGFSVAAARQARIAEPQVNAATGKRMDAIDPKVVPRWTSGGGGMISTAQDYARFCQMLLNGGTLDGVRIVSKASVDQMMTNQLPAQLPAGPGTRMFFFLPSVDNGNGFGLGGAVRIADGTNGTAGSIGDYSWSGAYGTYFWVDPKQRLVGILMIQAPFVAMVPVWRSAREYVYRAVQ